MLNETGARRIMAALALALGLAAGSAQASTLIGSTAQVSVTGNSLINGPSSATVGAGTEFNVRVFVPLAIDISATSVTYTNTDATIIYTSTTARSITLAGLDFTGPAAIISGISLAASGVSGISAANVAFGPSSLTLAFEFSQWEPSSSIVVSLQTRATGETPVPLPGALALLVPALLGLGMLRRRA
jgi:hypothetical protein